MVVESRIGDKRVLSRRSMGEAGELSEVHSALLGTSSSTTSHFCVPHHVLPVSVHARGISGALPAAAGPAPCGSRDVQMPGRSIFSVFQQTRCITHPSVDCYVTDSPRHSSGGLACPGGERAERHRGGRGRLHGARGEQRDRRRG